MTKCGMFIWKGNSNKLSLAVFASNISLEMEIVSKKSDIISAVEQFRRLRWQLQVH